MPFIPEIGDRVRIVSVQPSSVWYPQHAMFEGQVGTIVPDMVCGAAPSDQPGTGGIGCAIQLDGLRDNDTNGYFCFFGVVVEKVDD